MNKHTPPLINTSSQPVILVIDDESGFRESLSILLRTKMGAKVLTAESTAEGLAKLTATKPTVVLSDVFMDGGEHGLSILEESRRIWPDVPVILMSAVASRDAAIRAVNARAFWFLEKPFASETLLRLLRQAVTVSRTRSESSQGDGTPRRSKRHNHAGERNALKVGPFISSSEGMKVVMGQVGSYASSDEPILILGAVGVGKSRVARYSAESRSGEGNDIITWDRLGRESSLIDMARKLRAKEDLPQCLVGSDIIVEDVTSLSSAAQQAWVDLLTPEREGGLAPKIGHGPRWIATASNSLSLDASLGHIREDLYFRLAVHVIRIPDLAERMEDIESLAQSLLTTLRQQDPRRVSEKVSEDGIDLLKSHNWGGNLRELRNVLSQAALRSGVLISAGEIQDSLRSAR